MAKANPVEALKQKVLQADAAEREDRKAKQWEKLAGERARGLAMLAMLPREVRKVLGEPLYLRYCPQDTVIPERTEGIALVPGHSPIQIDMRFGSGKGYPDKRAGTWHWTYSVPTYFQLQRNHGTFERGVAYTTSGAVETSYTGTDMGRALIAAEKLFNETRVAMRGWPAPHLVHPNNGRLKTHKDSPWWGNRLTNDEDWLSRQLFPQGDGTRPYTVTVEVEVSARFETEALQVVTAQIKEGRVRGTTVVAPPEPVPAAPPALEQPRKRRIGL